MTQFRLDERLENDSVDIGSLGLCLIRLMNDARWPWLLLIPQIADASEIHDLEPAWQHQLADETFRAGAALKQITRCEKVNTAALGNIVSQLHVHVVARSTGDANWPGPVWGYGARQAYKVDELQATIDKIRRELFVNLL